jgi:hypothetical protein
LLPTPNTLDAEGGSRTGPGQIQLCHLAKTGHWPTPHGIGRDGQGSELSMAVAVSLGLSDSERSARKTPMWPTPMTVNSTSDKAKYGRPTAGPSRGGARWGLEDMARMWPTPNVPNGGRSPKPGKVGPTGQTEDGKKRQVDLQMAVRNWPTPNSGIHRTGMPNRVNDPAHAQGLQDHVARWPTPTAEDGESKGMSAKRLAVRDPDNLATAVKFPTPVARDWRSGLGRSENGHTPQLPETVGGQLNPTWVEWLMGLPLRWTDVAGSSD